MTITQQNLSRLNLTSVEELRLLDSNPDCKPLPCCGGSSWNWQFSEESLCGGQLKVQVQDNYEIVTLGNVVRPWIVCVDEIVVCLICLSICKV